MSIRELNDYRHDQLALQMAIETYCYNYKASKVLTILLAATESVIEKEA